MTKQFAFAAMIMAMVSACASVEPSPQSQTQAEPPQGLLAPLGPPVEVFVPTVPGAEPGYWIIGEQFSGQISYEDGPGGVEILYAHTRVGAPELIGDLSPASNWMSSGRRVFSGVSDTGVGISIAMTFQPCQMRGRTHARRASISIGNDRYQGCVTETGPFPAWSESLTSMQSSINACLSAATSPNVPIVHARSELGRDLIRARFGADEALYECAVERGVARWYALDAGAFTPNGQDRTVYVAGRRPASLDGCYAWENVLDASGRQIGALGEDACGVSVAPGRS